MRLKENFYRQDAVTAARNLIGTILVRQIDRQKLKCRIVETEAYMGAADKASHAYGNKRTDRTEVMFESGGYAYIYLIYGMYHCFNVVCGKEDEPEAVLIRAGEPISGIDVMRENRDIKDREIKGLTDGPGKLCQAMEIDKKMNGINLTSSNVLYIEEDNQEEDFEISVGKRINVDYAGEYKDKMWRFYMKDNLFVSEENN